MEPMDIETTFNPLDFVNFNCKPSYSTSDTNIKYRRIGKLGKSKHKVKLVVDQNMNMHALKIFSSNLPEAKLNYFHEKQIYQNIGSNPHIMRCLDYLEYEVHINHKGSAYHYNALVLEYCSRYQLFDYVCKTGPFNEPMCRAIFKQIATGLQHLHKNGIAHLDMKLENLFVDDQYCVKIGDFDLSSAIKLQRNCVGTPNYLAPEIWENNMYMGDEVDIFALGVVLFSLKSGVSPFRLARSNDELFKWIAKNRPEKFWNAFEKKGVEFSAELKQLLWRMFSCDVAARPSINEVLNCAWLQDCCCTDELDYKQEMEYRALNIQKYISENSI